MEMPQPTDIEFFEIGIGRKEDQKVKDWWAEHSTDIVKWEIINGSAGGSSKLVVEYRKK